MAVNVPEEDFFSRSSFRAGIYNYRKDDSGIITLGYSYNVDKDFNVGYACLVFADANSGGYYQHQIGLSLKYI